MSNLSTSATALDLIVQRQRLTEEVARDLGYCVLPGIHGVPEHLAEELLMHHDGKDMRDSRIPTAKVCGVDLFIIKSPDYH